MYVPSVMLSDTEGVHLEQKQPFHVQLIIKKGKLQLHVCCLQQTANCSNTLSNTELEFIQHAKCYPTVVRLDTYIYIVKIPTYSDITHRQKLSHARGRAWF